MDKRAKIDRLLALEEKRRRALRAKPVYVPNDGQLPVHLSDSRERWVFSANGTGKTTALCQEVHWAATGYNPITDKYTKAPCKVVMVLDKSDKIGEVFLPEYRKWFDLTEEQCKKNGKPYVVQLNYPNGSVVSFYSAEADPMSFEGFQADFAFADEPLPKPLVTAIRRSLRIKNSPSRLTFFGTAISQAWLRTEVYEPWSKGELLGVECFRVGIEVNRKNLSEGYIEQFAQGLSEAEKETRLRGGWFDTDSMALAHLWDRSMHVLPADKWKYNPKWPCVIGIDPHTSKPHTAIMICAPEKDRIVAIKELRLRGNASQFATALKEFMKGHTVIDIVSDSAGNADGTALEGFDSFIRVLQKNGVRVRGTSFKEKSHEDLIARMQNGLVIPEEADQFGKRVPKLRVLSTLTSLITDIEGATFQKNRATGETIPKLDTSIRDHLSCLGYALACNLFADKKLRSAPVYRNDIAPEVTGGAIARQERREAFITSRRARMARRRTAAYNRRQKETS
jgi:phage terminase large subunit-like protein